MHNVHNLSIIHIIATQYTVSIHLHVAQPLDIFPKVWCHSCMCQEAWPWNMHNKNLHNYVVIGITVCSKLATLWCLLSHRYVYSTIMIVYSGIMTTPIHPNRSKTTRPIHPNRSKITRPIHPKRSKITPEVVQSAISEPEVTGNQTGSGLNCHFWTGSD